MSTPNHDSDQPRYVTSGHAITIVYDGKGQDFPKGDPRGRPAEPKFELAYDRSLKFGRLNIDKIGILSHARSEPRLSGWRA